MNTQKKIQLEHFFWKIREFLEVRSLYTTSSYLGFPFQQCWNASVLFGLVVSNRYVDQQINWILGRLNGFSGHSWIEIDRFRYDLTADQYNVPRSKLISLISYSKEDSLIEYESILSGSFSSLNIDTDSVEGYRDIQVMLSKY